jgi:pilus assembly protein Flp/PilA
VVNAFHVFLLVPLDVNGKKAMRMLSMPAARAIIRWLTAGSDRGVTAIEYGLIAALISIAIITAVTLVGTDLAALFTTIAGKLHT